MKIIQALTTALTALACGSALTAHAQDFPTRPIRWIVPYLAGTAPDNTVRIVADAMGGILKQAVVVDNKPGAAGNLGAQLAARAPADGYTWVYAATPMAASMRMTTRTRQAANCCSRSGSAPTPWVFTA